MKISIDYDDTYTRDPLLWNEFIYTAMREGHVVWCVSAREEFHMKEVRKALGPTIGDYKCVGTGGLAKADYMWGAHGTIIDVWIDDQPDAVVRGYEVSDNSLAGRM